MRTNSKFSSKREATFKASKKGKNKEYVSSESYDEESDSKETHFMRKLKKGSSKYKGKLSFKCFSCGMVEHFATKCPYAKSEDSNYEKKPKFNNKYKGKENKSLKFKKSLYSKEESCSSDVSDEESLSKEILSMVIEEVHAENQEDEDHFDLEEGEIDFEEELISALSEMKRLRKKNQNLKLLLQEENEMKTKTSQAMWLSA